MNKMMVKDELKNIIASDFPPDSAEFRPCAFFDNRLDCIRVFTRDCSVTEERINERLTVLVDNYPEPGVNRYVGFSIKGVRHFCQEIGLGWNASVKLSMLLDALIVKYPDAIVDSVVTHVARPLIREGAIEEVSLPAAA
jgi:hypothetical protein